MILLAVSSCLCVWCLTGTVWVFSDGKQIKMTDIDSIMLNQPDLDLVDGYQYVDLGLPSGILWAKMNVGANRTWEFGGKYTWGTTVPAEYDFVIQDNEYYSCYRLSMVGLLARKRQCGYGSGERSKSLSKWTVFSLITLRKDNYPGHFMFPTVLIFAFRKEISNIRQVLARGVSQSNNMMWSDKTTNIYLQPTMGG